MEFVGREIMKKKRKEISPLEKKKEKKSKTSCMPVIHGHAAYYAAVPSRYRARSCSTRWIPWHAQHPRATLLYHAPYLGAWYGMAWGSTLILRYV